jgi:chromosome segregation ATPase
LRVELLAKESDNGMLSEQVTELEKRVDALTCEIAKLRTAKASLEATLDEFRAEKKSRLIQLKDAHDTVQKQERACQVAQRQSAESNARLEETIKQLDQRRSYALDRKSRVEYLETELAKQLVAAKRQSTEETARLLLAAIASFGVGAIVTQSKA